MLKRSGIVVVNRFESLRRALTFRVLPLRLALPRMTHVDVCARYRGFDGVVWPEPVPEGLHVTDGLVANDKLLLVESYVAALEYPEEWEILTLVVQGGPHPGDVGDAWRFVGYDVGYYESTGGIFSVIMNEVLYGQYPELTDFAAQLNEHLLMGSRQAAESLVTAHEQLAEKGADVEYDGRMYPVEVHVRVGAATPRQRAES